MNKYRCPVCRKILEAPSHERPDEAKFFPFCSKRCKLVDLGAWLDADYKIISTPQLQHPDDSSGNL